MTAYRYLIAVGFGLLGFLAIAKCTACGTPAQDASEAAYTAALLRCVDKAETLAESRMCRRTVDAQWGITEVVAKDGGR